MNPHQIGFNWLCYHKEQADFDFLAAFRPKSLKVFEWMWSNRDFCADMVAAVGPECIFLARDINLSHEHDRLTDNPAETGRQHARFWAEKTASGQFFLPPERTYVCGINEYDENGKEELFDAYTENFILSSAAAGNRVLAYQFAAGHPSTVDRTPRTDPDWSHYRASAHALIEHDGLVGLHEYGLPHDMGWGYWLGRSHFCPYPLTVVYDEFGIDWGVGGGSVRGYVGSLSPDDYAKWLDDGMQGVWGLLRKAESPIQAHSFCIFTYDSNVDWHSFDVRGMRQQMLAYPWTAAPSTPTLPTAPPRQELRIPYVSLPPNTPSLDDQEENWRRSIDFVLGWEGGYVNHPEDPGGETKWGISKGGHPELDIPNLTREQAVEIYRTQYWEASGASRMAWPMCLVHFDAYVQNPAAAQKFLAAAGQDPLRYLGHRMRWYASLDKFPIFGRSWIRRCIDLLEIVAND